jgi:hypothetical protein
MQPRKPNPAARDSARQEKLLDACRRFSGVELQTTSRTLSESR